MWSDSSSRKMLLFADLQKATDYWTLNYLVYLLIVHLNGTQFSSASPSRCIHDNIVFVQWHSHFVCLIKIVLNRFWFGLFCIMTLLYRDCSQLRKTSIWSCKKYAKKNLPIWNYCDHHLLVFNRYTEDVLLSFETSTIEDG